jgi:hypothetical protein
MAIFSAPATTPAVKARLSMMSLRDIEELLQEFVKAEVQHNITILSSNG